MSEEQLSGGDKGLKAVTLEELKGHKDASSLWLAIHDNVYDVTKFIEEVRYEL